jgi:hypothetical protein
MAARLPLLRAAGIPFGFILRLTRVNLDELFWVARFARDEGAKLLQIRPLDGESATRRPRETGVGAAYLAAMRHSGRGADRMTIRLDLARRNAVQDAVARGPIGGQIDFKEGPLADLVEALAVEADGVVVPLEHGFPRRYALGDLRCARLPVLAARWRSGGGWTGFRAHCEARARAARADPAALSGFNWFGAVSARLGPPVALAVD